MQRRPGLNRLLRWEDELFAALAAFLDYQSLVSNGGTFAENLYGLRRRRHGAALEPPASSLLLTDRHAAQRWATLMVLVGLLSLAARLHPRLSVTCSDNGALPTQRHAQSWICEGLHPIAVCEHSLNYYFFLFLDFCS
jgi:Pex2 / Pex12 amino terminal region